MTDSQELILLAAKPCRWNKSEEARVRKLIGKLVLAPSMDAVDHGEPLPFHCDSCGKDHEYVLLNGYYFGDRLLEDVYFEIRRYADGAWVAKVSEGDKPYMADLNEQHWLDRAAEYAAKRDLFTCPNRACRDDVVNPLFADTEEVP